MNKIAKSVVQGTPVGTGVGMRPETLDLEIDDLYELSSPNVGTYIRRLRPYVSAWEADRKAASEMAVERQDLLARIEALEARARAEMSHSTSVEDDLLTAQTHIEALEKVLHGTQLWLMSFLTSADEPCLVSRRSIKEYAADIADARAAALVRKEPRKPLSKMPLGEMTPEVSMVDTLRHIADDHPCCRGSLLAAAAYIEALERAAQFKRNVIIHDSDNFVGRWVAVPEKDFNALHAALAAEDKG